MAVIQRFNRSLKTRYEENSVPDKQLIKDDLFPKYPRLMRDYSRQKNKVLSLYRPIIKLVSTPRSKKLRKYILVTNK
jgi:hypothetical protein